MLAATCATGRGPAEITTLLDLGDWPAGRRVIARKERPHPGAQLTLTDTDGHRVTCFATNDPSPDLPAMDLTTWAQQLARTGTWRVAQPKTLRLKLFATASRHINAARRRIIDLDPDWPRGNHPTAHDPNHGDRHPGPRDKQPRPNGLTPEKSKTNRNQQPR